MTVQAPGPDPLDCYAVAWRKRFRAEADRLRAARVRALESAHKCADVLVDEFGAECVTLTGSLSRGGTYHERSDIDLAVQGLPAGAYLRALTAVSDLAERAVDLIPLEDATPEMVEHVMKEGRLLRGRSNVPAAQG